MIKLKDILSELHPSKLHEYSAEEEYAKEWNSYKPDDVLVQVGNEKITKKDIEEKHLGSIRSYYGSYEPYYIFEALSNLYEVVQYYEEGGILYRVLWLKSLRYLNKKELGRHWVSDKGKLENIVDITSSWYDEDTPGATKGMGTTPYVVVVKTPPRNVAIPFDYFNNLNEQETTVVDDSKLELIGVTKYERGWERKIKIQTT